MTDNISPQLTQDGDIRSQKATVVDLTDRCWWCDRPIPTYQGEAQGNLILIDPNHLVAFCKDAYCFTEWFNEQSNIEIGYDKKLAEYKVVPLGSKDAYKKGGYPSFYAPAKKEGDHPQEGPVIKEGDPPLETAHKGGYPSSVYSANKRRVTLLSEGGSFTLDDVRKMKYWHPLYKELKTILKEQGHWKDLPKGGSFKPGNAHRFTTKDAN